MEANKITLNIAGQAMAFNVTPEDQEKMINETTQDNKVAPMHNFLMRTVDPACKEDLKKLLIIPASTIKICTFVNQEYIPELNIKLGE